MAKTDSALAKVGRNLRKARLARGLSQEELAHRSGVHRTYIGAIERGEYNFTILSLRKITRALGISLRAAVDDVS